jgi:hypothetical protein
MKKLKYKAIVSDIDGTLTPSAPNSFPTDKATKHIKEAIDNGLIFSLASGRPFSMVKYIANHLGNVGPCIVDNGAVIINPITEEILWEAILPSKVANKILKLAKSYELSRASCDIGIFENTHSVPLESKVRKVSIHNLKHSEAERLINEITSEYKDIVGVKAGSYEGDHLIDIYFSNINATKQNAVVKLAEIWGISPTDIIGIGDGHNDISLLNACGLKIAMGNAVEELKAIAHYIAPSYIDDGIIDIINKNYN